MILKSLANGIFFFQLYHFYLLLLPRLHRRGLIRDGMPRKIYVKGGEISKRGQKRVGKVKYEENINKKCGDLRPDGA